VTLGATQMNLCINSYILLATYGLRTIAQHIGMEGFIKYYGGCGGCGFDPYQFHEF
jgi:hypothetical protein